MNNLKCVLLYVFLVAVVAGCGSDYLDEPNAFQSSALTADAVEQESDTQSFAQEADSKKPENEPVTILGKEALMKRIAELRMESPVFAAAMDGAYDGVAPGERTIVKTKERPVPRDSAVEWGSKGSEETDKPVAGVVPFSSDRKGANLRARIHAGVDESDLEPERDSEEVIDSPRYEPGPFSF